MNNVFILHGWGASAQNWQRVKEILESNGFNVLVPDLPGFGANPPPPEPWSVDDYVEWVKSLSEKQNFSPFFLLGHSFGGRIAIKFAVKYPEEVKGLILCGVPALRAEENTTKLVAWAASKISSRFYFLPFYKTFRKIFYRYILRKTDYVRLEGVMKETFKKVIDENLAPYLPQIRQKTLIVWGERDNFVPVEVGSFAKERIPNSELIIFPDIGHKLYRDIPEKFSEVLLRFFNTE